MSASARQRQENKPRSSPVNTSPSSERPKSTTAPIEAMQPIQRVLYTCPSAQIFAVPPLTAATSKRGYIASQWTTRPPIFTARVRIIETETEEADSEPSSSVAATVSVSVSLEDPTSGELFAAAPYTHPSAVTPCADSTRFFAVRVVGDGGRMKATLGVGFEDRSDAFDFGVALQAVGRSLDFGDSGRSAAGKEARGHDETGKARELGLKEGEMMTVNVAGWGGVATERDGEHTSTQFANGGDGTGFLDKEGPLIPPPPPPPPSGGVVTGEAEAYSETTSDKTADQVDLDDEDEFGEFQ